MWSKPSARMQHALCVPYKAPLATAQRMTAWLDEDQQLCGRGGSENTGNFDRRSRTALSYQNFR
jgi:hypothetical protein